MAVGRAGGVGEDAKLGPEVALKVLPEEMVRDPERLERFELCLRRLHPATQSAAGFWPEAT